MTAASPTTTNQVLSPLFPYEPLTADQLKLMEEFATRVEALPEVSSTFYDIYVNRREEFLVKFLTARKWVVNDAVAMLTGATEFRKQRGLDVNPLFPAVIKCHGFDQDVLATFQKRGVRQPSELDRYNSQLKNCYASSWHKVDRDGRPVYYERTGRINVKEIVRRSKQMVPPGGNYHEPCIACHIHANEVGGALLNYVNANRKPGDKLISQISVVMDCSGFTLGHLFGPAMDILKAQSAMDQANYPEGLHRLYVANAPTALSVGWNLVKGWLDPRVQKKVVIMKPGSETRKGLLEAIDEANLPDFLGGKCKCEGGCVGSENATAEEEDDDEFADTAVKTEILKVPARDKVEKVVPVEANTQTAWEFHTEGKMDIQLSVSFAPADNGASTVVAEPLRVGTGNGQCVNRSAGSLTFVFDNSYSWVSKKTVCFLVASTPLEQQ